MKRTPLVVIAFAAALACGAWRTDAGAHSSSSGDPAPNAAPRFPPVPSPTSPRKIDEYGDISWRDEKERLKNLAVEVRNWPEAVAYLVCYGGRRGRAGEARLRCARAADYLVKSAGITPSRVKTLDGGFREDLTVELWVPPAWANPPQASPTVDPSEVTIIKDVPKRKRVPRPARRKPAR